MQKLTSEALNVGTSVNTTFVRLAATTVREPGGKLVAMGIDQIIAVIRKRGHAFVAEVESNRAFGDDLIENKASMNDTFSGTCRKRCHRYCVKARPRLDLRDSPKALAISVEAVVIYVWLTCACGPSAGIPDKVRKSKQCTTARTAAAHVSVAIGD